MRYCVDCKHFQEFEPIAVGVGSDIQKYSQRVDWCNSPNRPRDIVRGHLKIMTADHARQMDNYCSRESVWFEDPVQDDLDDLSTIPFGR